MIQGNKAIFLGTASFEEKPDIQHLGDLAAELSDFLGFKHFDYNYHLYPGDGITLTMFLAESHITLDTYPEYNLLEISVVSCKTIDITYLTEFLSNRGYTLQNHTVLHKKGNHRWFAL